MREKTLRIILWCFFTACVNVYLSVCVSTGNAASLYFNFLFGVRRVRCCCCSCLFFFPFFCMSSLGAAIVLPPPTGRTMSYCHHIRTSASIHNLNRFIPTLCDETRIAVSILLERRTLKISEEFINLNILRPSIELAFSFLDKCGRFALLVTPVSRFLCLTGETRSFI